MSNAANNLKPPTVTAAPAASSGAKSGLRKLAPNEILFEDGAKAESLYIIQKGQLRLYKPKGRGFVEIAVLRSGEVIGEMAYFDSDGGGKRSCAASAMVSSEVIEISFQAFAKTMEALNPWFKTIINTLATRLRASNSRIKEMESNSAGVNYATGKHSDYEFLKNHEVIKILGSLFVVIKSHGEKHDLGLALHRRTIDLYFKDVFGLMETKVDGLLYLLKDLGLMTIENDKDGMPKIFIAKNIDMIRHIFVFYNTEKSVVDDKKVNVDERCQLFLEKIYSAASTLPDNPPKVPFNISPILAEFKKKNVSVGTQNLEDAKANGICGEIMIGKDNVMNLELYLDKLRKLLPIIQFKNALKKLNLEKQKG
jgi:CRP/FNR family cyclic AMP-dependent transcriptional regulator